MSNFLSDQHQHKLRGKLNALYFPVALRPIFYMSSLRSARQLHLGTAEGFQGHPTPVRRYRVVVNLRDDHVLGVVSRDYRLVTHKQAVEAGQEAFAQLFPSASASDFKLYQVTAPSTGSYCYVDLIHAQYRIDVWKQETWLPYVRVTNSYNTTRALRYEIGFVRKACSNGTIFDKDTIKVTFSHTKDEISSDDVRRAIRLDGRFSKLQVLESEFRKHMKTLRDAKVPRLYALPVVARALDLSFKVDSGSADKRKREEAKLVDFKETAGPLVKKYYAEMGPTAYALFNAMTEYASRPRRKGDALYIASRQHRVGKWLRGYVRQARKRTFDLDAYVEDYLPLFTS